jgi:subtilisin
MAGLVLVRPAADIAAQETFGEAAVAPNRYIVRLRESAPGFTSASSIASSYDAMTGVAIDQVYGSVFSGFAGEFTDDAARRLAADPNVLDVVPDRLSYLAAQEEPPGIGRIDADLNPTKAGNGNGSVDADIAVLDTGIYKHPDLNVVGGKDCTRTRLSGPYHDISGHGTHVAGSAAAKDNGIGVVGVAPGARLWAVKIFSDDGRGAALESEVTCGLDYVRAMAGTIEVINLSIGANYRYDLGGCAAHPYHQAYCNVVNSGITVVVAAQNWTINARTVVPAQFDEVITVSAYYDSDGNRGGLGPVSDCTPLGGSRGVQDDDTFACFSNYGHDIDISAPGMDVLSTFSADAEPDWDYCPSATYCEMSGTSMSTPHVAGAVALLHAQQGRMSPAATKARLLLTAERGPVPLDPDGMDEPMLNVAQLGKGTINAPGRVKVGQRIEVDVDEFTPGERAIFRFNGKYVGGDTIDNDGTGSRRFTIPEMTNGHYKLTVSTGQKQVSATIKVAPLIALEVTSGPVGETVNVQLCGFGDRESVLISFDTGPVTRSMVRVTISQTGSADVSFVVPPSTGGRHRVTATGNKGNSTYASFVTRASAYVSDGLPEPGRLVRVQFRGCEGGEGIEVRFDMQSGPVLGSATASSTGSGSIAVRIPSDSSSGAHYLWLLGDAGNEIRVPLTLSEASLPTPSPTLTATPVSSETSVPTEESPTETSTIAPTAIPTDPVTPEPPTETLTATPTEIGTPEPSPTETPEVPE